MTICTTGTHTCLDVNTELVLELGCCRMELASVAPDGDLRFSLASWLHTIGFMIFASETEVLKLKKSKTVHLSVYSSFVTMTINFWTALSTTDRVPSSVL